MNSSGHGGQHTAVTTSRCPRAHRWYRPAVAVALALVAVLSACTGNDTHSGPADTPSPAESSPASSDTAVPSHSPSARETASPIPENPPATVDFGRAVAAIPMSGPKGSRIHWRLPKEQSKPVKLAYLAGQRYEALRTLAAATPTVGPVRWFPAVATNGPLAAMWDTYKDLQPGQLTGPSWIWFDSPTKSTSTHVQFATCYVAHRNSSSTGWLVKSWMLGVQKVPVPGHGQRWKVASDSERPSATFQTRCERWGTSVKKANSGK